MVNYKGVAQGFVVMEVFCILIVVTVTRIYKRNKMAQNYAPRLDQCQILALALYCSYM